VLDTVVRRELRVAQGERRGHHAERGSEQLICGRAVPAAPRGGRQHRRADHRGEHLHVLEGKLHRGHAALDHRKERERLAEARHATQPRELRHPAPEARLVTGFDAQATV
jgi:hypothetical protein